jgi:hypothetical protein
MKVKVTLRHPFPNSPEYTGFDVRGTIMFPATRYWKREPQCLLNEHNEYIFKNFDPFYFSRAEDGGGQLLNADGFTLYFFPGFYIPGFDLPIFKYSKGKHAYGPDPDSTVNGYKLFTNDPDRRMFRVVDIISRTYHIAPPQGGFIFGYVVDACWAQPTVTPVTNPKNDFPFWANCEDGYVLESEQIKPFKTGTYGSPWVPPHPPPILERHVTSVTYQLYHVNCSSGVPTNIPVWLMCPDITSDQQLKTYAVAHSMGKEVLDFDAKVYKSYQGIRKGTYDAEPGSYLALLFVNPNLFEAGWREDDNYWPCQLKSTAFFDFIYLDVVAGD